VILRGVALAVMVFFAADFLLFQLRKHGAQRGASVRGAGRVRAVLCAAAEGLLREGAFRARPAPMGACATEGGCWWSAARATSDALLGGAPAWPAAIRFGYWTA
jgi:hypothetical protein